MKKVLAILLALSLALGCGLSGLAEETTWSGEQEGQSKQVTFFLVKPAEEYNVVINYIDPAWEVTYEWDAEESAFYAVATDTSGGAQGLSVVNNSSASIYFSVAVTVEDGDYTDATLAALGLTRSLPDSVNYVEVPSGEGTEEKYGKTTLESSGVVDITVFEEMSGWDYTGEDRFLSGNLATITITLTTQPDTE